MPDPGESRAAARIGVVVVVLAGLGGGLWWRQHRRASDGPATSTATQPQHGSAASTATRRAAPVEPARLAVTVSDDQGPLADATVRLAPKDGEIVVVKTGRDGVAHADQLEAGDWTVSASAADHLPGALPAKQLAAGASEQLAIKLAAGGRTLSGTVSDTTGGPIAGARIDAARVNTMAEPGDAVSTTFSGADGKYRVTVAEGQLAVAAASADYAPQSRYVLVGPAGAVADFALVPGGVIEGVVRDERTRQPVAGASVLARRDSPAMVLVETGTHRAISGGDGRFRLGGLRPGAWEISATDHARYSKAQTLIGLGVAEQVSDVELLIGAGPVIRGHVVDTAGAPAPNVEIRAFSRGEGTEGKADAAGAFTLEGLRPGEYFLTANAEAYLPAGGTRVPVGDKDVDGVVITVKRGTTLKGHVEPRQVCDIQQYLDDHEGLLVLTPGTSTAADGEFELGPFGDGTVKLTARCASGDQGATQVKITPGMPEAILKVTPGGSIAGRVVDGEGKPVAGVGVMASNISGTESTIIRNGMVTSGVQGLTDVTGAYQLVGLSPGAYRMGVLDRGKPLAQRGKPPTIELTASEHKTSVDLAIDRPTGVITGTVTGPDGKPLADAWVSAQQDMMSMLDSMRGAPDPKAASGSRMMVVEDREGPGGAPETTYPPALTDAQGRYAIRGLPHATYTVVAEAQRGQLRGRATDIKPDATVDLRALGVTTLSGTVTGAAGPTGLFSVELDGTTRAQRSFTDGKFSFGRVDPGSYTVRVQATDGNAETKLTVTPDQPATIDIILASNAVVIGKLVDAAGKPLAGQAVILTPDHDDGHLEVRIEGPPPTTGPDGSFRLEHRAERCALMVMRPPRPFSRRGLVLEAGKTLDLGTVTVDTPAAGSGSPPPRP
jgi:Carboxypeptidase regulatory-like domain